MTALNPGNTPEALHQEGASTLLLSTARHVFFFSEASSQRLAVA
jgi:hypothetical protein